MNTESSRIASILSKTRSLVSKQALERARITSSYACGAACNKRVDTPVQTSSDFLLASQCSGYVGPAGAVPESIRIAMAEQYAIDCGYGGINGSLPSYVNPRRTIIQVCPPIPEWYYTSGEPKPQMLACGLPNKPYNPVIPG